MRGNTTESFRGKVAFVTGAGSGIARAAAVAFARAGARVAVADVSGRGSQETAQSIEEFGGRALAVECDVTRTEHVTAALDKAVEEFGHLDFAFNNAGAEQPVTPAADLTEQDWDRIAAVKGFKGQAAYAAAKHGVIGLTKSAALDYASQRIRVNAVCPGIIETSMMDRFTGGTSEGRERVIAQEPSRKNGQARRDRCGGRLAMFGSGCLRDRARHGH